MNNIVEESKTSPHNLTHQGLRSIKQLYGKKLAASDGDIGHVKDFYFDDQRWAVRYVVADTGSWLPGRMVLISPHAFGNIYQDGDWLLVNQTRKEIENSPPVESQKPVSRQYEEEHYRYYVYPSYWNGAELWGGAGFPGIPAQDLKQPNEESQYFRSSNGEDPHLRSAKEVGGYHIQTREGAVGHVADFMMDEKSWAIDHLVIETGLWFFGKDIALSPKDIDRISYEESKVFVNLMPNAIRGR